MVSLLPQELVDQIINNLRDDIISLHACSLVCRAWSVSAQSRIFGVISVSFSVQRTKAFARLLETSPRVAQLVKDLTVNVAIPPWGIQYGKHIIHHMGTQFINLQRLSVTALDLRDATLSSTFLESFTSIRYLSLFDPLFNTVSDLIGVLTSHPNIEELVLSGISYAVEDGPSGDLTLNATTRISRSLPSLRRFAIEGGISQSLIVWMIRQQCTRHIRTARFFVVLEKDALALAHFLKYGGASIKHLSLGLTSTISPREAKDMARVISLATCTSLRTLAFEGLSLAGTAHNEWVLGILDQISSSDIEEIIFKIFRWRGLLAGLEEINLPQIDNILTRTSFNTLKKVTISFDDPWNQATAMRQQVIGKLNGLNSRKILVVS